MGVVFALLGAMDTACRFLFPFGRDRWFAFAQDLTLFFSFLQGIIQINLSSTLALSVGFAALGITQVNLN